MFGKIVRAFKRVRASVQYAKAVEKAENALLQTGKRWYVFGGMTTSGKPRLVLTDRDNMRLLKRKKYLHQSMRIADMERICFYCTSYANGDGFMTDEQKENGKARAMRWMMQ